MTKIVGDSKPPLDEVAESASDFSHTMALGGEFLEHHGIKGMRWGVRKAGTSGTSVGGKSFSPKKTAKIAEKQAAQKKAGEAYFNKKETEREQKWQKAALGNKYQDKFLDPRIMQDTAVSAHKISNSPKYKGKDFNNDTPLRRDYYNDVAKAMEHNFNKTYRTEYPVSPLSGKTVGVKVTVDPKTGFTTITKSVVDAAKHDAIQHAVGDLITSFKPVFDSAGYITDFEIVSDTLQQSDDDAEFLHAMSIGEDFLEHHGIKGMKWGVRKAVNGVYRTSAAQTRVAKATGRGAATAGKTAVKGVYATSRAQNSAAKSVGNVAGKGLSAYKSNRLNSLDRVASGNSSNLNKGRVLLSSSPTSLIRNKGLKGSAKVRSGNVHAREARLANGNGSAADHLLKYTTTSVGLNTGGKNKDTRFTASKDKLTVNAHDHAVTKNVKKDHNNLSDGEFQRKYKITKSAYRKRVAKNQDPFASAISKHPSNRP